MERLLLLLFLFLLMTLSPTLSSSALSPLLSKVAALSELSGSFYFYEPRERLLSRESGSALSWESVSPNEEDSLSFGCLDPYSLQLCSSLHGSLGLSPEEAVSKIASRKLWQSMSLLWVPDYCQAGDYGGAIHYLSNARVLLKEHGGSPECRELYGSYGSSGIVVDPRYLSEELLESLQSLESYPVLDEEDSSSLELELQSEAWESHLSRDFLRALERSLSELLSYEEDGDERAEQLAESLSEEQLYSLMENAREELNLYWSSEHNSMWIDVDPLAERAAEELLSASVLSLS
jgi:hypothetical protein